MRRLTFRLRAWLAALGIAACTTAALATTIESFSPQGEIAQVRQIALRFSEAVVPLGEARLPDPVAVRCTGDTPTGKGRWLDARSWVHDFADALPPGSRCTVKLRSEWKPLASASALSGRSEFSFNTGGPAVVSVSPYEGATVEEDQHFLLRLNGPAVDATVAANAWCEVEGIGERQPVQLVGGAERDAVFKARKISGPKAARALLLRCPRPLPGGASVRLVWGRGIAAKADPKLLTTIEQAYSFTVRAAFTAEFSCERERAAADCLPIRPVSVRFSAPVKRELAAQLRLIATDGKTFQPLFDKEDALEVSEIAFPVPLPINSRLRLEMPKSIQDVSGRPLTNAASFPLEVKTGDAPPIAKFAAAPFGIVESADPVVPLTLRHVQGDLRALAGKVDGPGNGVRVKRIDADAEMLDWFNKLQRFHERTMSAEEAGLPKSQWTVIERERDARGRTIERRVERQVGTRELSLLNRLPEVKRLDLPQLQGGDPRPFEVVGIPLGEPGYHVVEIESARLGQSLLDKRAPLFVRSGVLVTNLGVHFKLGRDNSLVWVTSLDRGQVVADAEVSIYNCFGKRLWNGRSDARGLAAIKLTLDPEMGNCPGESGFFVTARRLVPDGPFKGRTDVSFVFSNWQKGIEGWRFGLPTGNGVQPQMRTHTVFDRSLLRAGETVSMKHFARLETGDGLAPVPMADLPSRIKIVHQGSGEEVVQPLAWQGARSAVSTWTIPVAAKLGSYEIFLERDGDAGGRRQTIWSSGDFRVEEFRVPLIDARLSAPKEVPVAPSQLSFALQMNYLAGGPMANSPVSASALLKRRHVSFDGRTAFSFDPPAESSERNPPEEDEGDSPPQREGRLVADKLALTTDRQGAANIVLKDLPAVDRPGELLVEVAFNDPNGETATVATRLALWPSAVVPGIKTSSWPNSRGPVKFTAIALDTAGRVIKGQQLLVRGRHTQVISTRKRLVGGFYAYENHDEVKDLGSLCSGTSDERGLLLCEANIDRSGQVELIVEAKDSAGHVGRAATSVWISGRDEAWFAQDNDDRIDILAEKLQYQPGETARLQVRMPFREATALVAVEREGVMDTRVVTLRGNDPTIEVPIQAGWGPNVYVSVLALRGRIRDVPWYSLFTWGWREPINWVRAFWYEGRRYQAPTAMVDLAKPSFKFGVAALKIGIDAHQLQVSVSADKPVYRVREKATVRVKVSQGGKPMAGAQVAFAAVDEGLLALRNNASWDLLGSMIRQRDWSVETSTAQSEIIGRRHYGRKAVAAGGGGGRGGVRELFDTLLTWQPLIVLDGNGEATIEVPLNDSLTSFRLVAIADDAPQKFGTGSTSIRVSQDLQALAGLPLLVRDGDRFSALLTLRNTTAKDMKVRATLLGTAQIGGANPASMPITLPAQDVALPAGAASAVSWPVEVPAQAVNLSWQVEAIEQGGGQAVDRLKLNQRVVAAVPLRVTQATLERIDGVFTLPVAAPVEALPVTGVRAGVKAGVKSGGIVAAVQPRLGAALPGIRRFFETYPYSCLEQEVSKAIGLGDRSLWASLTNRLPGYLDSDGLAAFFPPQPGDASAGSDRLTAHLIAAADEAGFEIPQASRQRMLQGLQAFVTGRIERRLWAPAFARTRDLDVRKLAAIEALSRHKLALPAMLGSINLAPNTWPTAAVIDWLRILKRVDGVPDSAQRIAEAQQILRSRLTFAGTTLKFSTEASDAWWWLMDSADANAARLILAVVDEAGWKDDLPRLVVGSLGRQQGGAWATTTANLWGVLALQKFAARFESTPVAGRTEFSIADAAGKASGSPLLVDWGRQPAGGEVRLPWPLDAGQFRAEHRGDGKPWLTVQALAAIPLTTAFNAGYGVTRSIRALERKTEGRWSRGDVMRVRLEIDAGSDMTWVVVNDPVPAGATVLGSGLGRDSAIASRDERREGSAWLAFEERSLEAYRAYHAFLPRGKHVIEYSLRLNNPGTFQLPPTRVEAMYAPETHGESPNAPIEVGP